jgi:hypothetical protein
VIKIFKHEHTHQVIEVPEVEPNLFEVLGSHFELSIMNSSGWWLCDVDPGYRGMPPEEEAVA